VALSARPQYRLDVRPPAPVAVPELDDAQRAVVEHVGGPLLVLAGPGTGKTTTLVEAVAARVAGGVDPSRILVLTFSRKAATELRDRISRRLGRTTAGPAAATFGSFCFGLVTAEAGPLRLLSGAEQEVAVRDLLAGSVAENLTRLPWPAEIAGAIGTRGLAEEVRDVLARVAARDVDLTDVAAADPGRAARWSALARFADIYLDVLEARGVLDHAELVRRAVALAEEPHRRAALRAQYAAVFVDEYQDVDPAQVRLLRALAGDGRDLVVFGDPDQSIYAFRGARVREILEFADAFPDRAGRPAPTRVLRTSRRCGPRLLAAGREVARRLPLAGLPVEAARAHRDLRPAAELPGELVVATYPSVGAELEHVADTLRRAHLQDGLPWSRMAVLVRSGTRSIPALRRVLGAAGVPFSVASDELPLRSEPAAAVLLTALQVAADPAALTAEVARELLLSPLGGMDPVHLRGLGRALRARARADAGGVRIAPSAQLIREALLEPGLLDGVEVPGAAAARACAALVARSRELAAAGAGAEDVLWVWWSGTDWPDRLARAAAGRGPAAARADRDLDAVCALFAQAGRAGEQAGGGGLRAFLAAVAAQQIPADPPAAADGPGEAVRVMTAHRSKGLEWDLVAVVGVQEGVWPDLRRRGSFLDADRISEHGLTEPTTVAELLAEERRLFYVAVTRARRRLLVTAVATPDEAGERPSRFLRELGVEPTAVSGRPARPLSPTGLVGELRAVVIDPDAAPPLRRAAADRLAVLARASTPDGAPLVPAAHPDRWWGLVEPSAAAEPVRAADAPVELTPSAVENLRSCPLQWFLRREVHAELAPTAALGFGNVLHALAEEVAAGAPADLESLTARLDTVWAELAYDAEWQSREQRAAALDALRRFLAWHAGRPDRTLLGVEVDFDVTVQVEDQAVRLRGRLDRVERDAGGGVRVIDFKTSKTPVSNAAVAEHAQLGVYQRVVTDNGLNLPGAGDVCGGAELVMLRQEQGRTGLPKVQAQTPPEHADDPQWVTRMLAEAARRVRGERFGPQPSEDCDRCPYRRCCPARPEGAQVVT
jgi:superfamily I DNA/RNA helicase/RecB family exonuclease